MLHQQLVRAMPHEPIHALKTPMLEELSNLEMQLPARCWSAIYVELIQTVTQVDADWAKGTYQSCTEPERTEQPRGIELTRAVPHIAALKERIDVKCLIHAKTELAGSGEECISKR